MATATDAATAPPATAAMANKLRQVVVALRRDLVVTRQIVFGGARYVVHDPVTFRNHILTPLEYRVLCSLVAHRTLGEIFESVVEQGALAHDDAEEFFGFVVALHGMGLLVVPGMPVEAAWQRQVDRRRRRPAAWRQVLLGLRISFGSPDRHLQRLLPAVRWLFAAPGLVLWAALFVLAAWQCGGRLGDLFGGAGDLLALHNLPLLWFTLVAMKVVHELGHAFALKRFCGVVPDLGVTFIMLTPCAYVDANASWTFAGRWPRVAVGLAGMYVETLVAFAFALLWAGTGPGLLHDLAHNVVVLATVTTVLINSNPLVKFDGYYVFSDLCGVVNLQERAARALRGLAEWLVLGLPRPEFELTRRERWLFLAYALATLAYRISLAVGITALMLTHWPGMGVLLGLAFGWLLIADPLRKLFVWLWRAERTNVVRWRARGVAVGAVLLAVLGLVLVPVSRSVVTQGVLDPGVRRVVRAPSNAFVAAVQVVDGQRVTPHTRLVQLEDPQIEARRVVVAAELNTARVRFDAVEAIDPVLAAATAARIAFLQQRATELDERAAQLTLAVEQAGTVVGARSVATGQFVRRGEELLQVHSEHQFVRIVLADRELARTRLQVGAVVELRWTCAPATAVRATVREIRSSASRYQVPAELTIAAGGQIHARPIGDQTAADQPYLHAFLSADWVPLPDAGGGLTASVRLPAQQESLGGWLQHRLLTFLRHWQMS